MKSSNSKSINRRRDGGEIMLIKPSIIRMPDSAFPSSDGTVACASSGYTGCKGNFTCSSSYKGGCVDVTHSCSSNLAGGILVGGTVDYTATVFIGGVVAVT